MDSAEITPGNVNLSNDAPQSVTPAEVDNGEKSFRPIEDFIPGTVQLLENGGIRLVPIPNNDPNDPLNWSKAEKNWILVALLFFATIGFACAQALGAIFPELIPVYLSEGATLSDVSNLITYNSLCIGLGAYIFTPLSLSFGRRPMLLVCTILQVVGCIWAATSVSVTSHLGARCLLGLSVGCNDGVVPLIINDIHFIHERGTRFGLFWCVQGFITTILVVAGSWMANPSWRWWYGYYAIFGGISFCLVFFLVPETRYKRPAMALDGHIAITDDYGHVRTIGNPEIEVERTASEPADPAAYLRRKTYLARLSPFSGMHEKGLRPTLSCWLEILECLTFPTVWWVMLINAMVLSVLVGIITQYSAILDNPPYDWPSRYVGLFNISYFIAAPIGFLFGGLGADKVAIFMARRNKGVHEAECRILAFIFPLFFATIGTIMTGLFWQNANSVHWIGMCISWTIFLAGFFGVLSVTTTFVVDCYSKWAGAVLVICSGTRNIIAFGVSQGVKPFTDRHGYAFAYGIFGLIIGSLGLMSILFYHFGKYMRRKSARMIEST